MSQEDSNTLKGTALLSKEDQADRAKLHKKLLTIAKSITTIEKKVKNDHFKYLFARDVDVINAVRGPMAEHGVTMIPVNTFLIRNDGGAGGRSTLVVTWRITDTETGFSEEIVWQSEAQDSQDKGINKAATANRKYLMINLFNIPTDLDPDGDAGVPDKPAQQQKPAPKAQEKPANPEADAKREAVTTFLKAAFDLPEDGKKFVADCKAAKLDWQEIVADVSAKNGGKVTKTTQKRIQSELLSKTVAAPQETPNE